MSDPQTKADWEELYASKTQSEHGSAGLFTSLNSYNPFDASAPGMTPAKALARAEQVARAANEFEALNALAESVQKLFNKKDCPHRFEYSELDATLEMRDRLNALKLRRAEMVQRHTPAGHEQCSCGSDTVLCQVCGGEVCGTLAQWMKPVPGKAFNGNVCQNCA